jgi:hypothetical protein
MRFFSLPGILLILLSACLPAMAQVPTPLPNSFVSIGENQVARAWLANPTTSYQHFVLGDRYEAASLVAEMRNGDILQYDLPQHLVFEDRHVRLADLNNDGNDELIVVMSSAVQGASLAVFAIKDDIKLLAQTPHIGLPFRWLNPAGIADFDGDGFLEIALVQKPHLTKRLEFWRLENGDLRRVAELDGYSNHRNGSRHQQMSAVVDVNKDGVSDLVLPGPNRKVLYAVSLLPKPNVIAKWPLNAPIDGDFALRSENERYTVVVTLENGAQHEIGLH